MNQLQQSVKRLEEQLAASNSKQSSDQGVTGQKFSNRLVDQTSSVRLEYVHKEFETLSDLSHPNIIHVLEKLPKVT